LASLFKEYPVNLFNSQSSSIRKFISKSGGAGMAIDYFFPEADPGIDSGPKAFLFRLKFH
jgi:hypothetical protein